MPLRATAVLVSLLLHSFIGYVLGTGGADAREEPKEQNILLPPVFASVTPEIERSTEVPAADCINLRRVVRKN